MNTYLIFREKGKDSMYKIWHCTNCPMLIYTYSNGGSIVFADKLFPIKRGTLCFIGAKRFRYTMPDIPDTYERTKIFYSTDDFEKILSSLSPDTTFNNRFTQNCDVCAIIDDDKIEEVEALLDELNNQANDKQYNRVHYASALIKLLVYIDKYSLTSIPSPKNFLSSAVSYINSNLSEKISIDEIAETCHMSKYYFCRCFKKTIGYTVMEYILKTRLANAKMLLMSSDVTISEISERCGFSSFSYFSRVFKENYGMAPKEFRKQNLT